MPVLLSKLPDWFIVRFMTCADGAGEVLGAGDALGEGDALGAGVALGDAEGSALSVGTGVGVEMTLGVSAGVGWALSEGTVSLMSRPVSHAESAAITISTSTSAMNMLILRLFMVITPICRLAASVASDYIPSAASKSIFLKAHRGGCGYAYCVNTVSGVLRKPQRADSR